MASLQPAGYMLETSCGSPHYACPEVIRVSCFIQLQNFPQLLRRNGVENKTYFRSILVRVRNMMEEEQTCGLVV